MRISTMPTNICIQKENLFKFSKAMSRYTFYPRMEITIFRISCNYKDYFEKERIALA